jgi:uncharacterized OsmC-like protein/TusA-related sulfurtransferase
MSDTRDLRGLEPDQVFDGGDLDCGSGLVLLLREAMARVPVGGILEMRSREPTVSDDLPPWCRMAGHDYLGRLVETGLARHFVRRGEKSAEETKALEEDKRKATEYEWRLRARSTGPLRSTVYCRNFSFDVGQPASFDEKDAHPSAVEYLLGALAGDLATGFATSCSRSGLEVDDVEISVKARLADALAHLGMSDGDPSLARIELKCFASTLDDEAKVREAWESTVARSPVARTLRKSVELVTRLVIV